MMGKLVEATHVTLGGEVGTTDWAFPYLDEQFSQYTTKLLVGADALLLGRHTYEFAARCASDEGDVRRAKAGLSFRGGRALLIAAKFRAGASPAVVRRRIPVATRCSLDPEAVGRRHSAVSRPSTRTGRYSARYDDGVPGVTSPVS
jgi:hypothetical protein